MKMTTMYRSKQQEHFCKLFNITLVEGKWTMARGRPAKPTQAQTLIEALDFVSLAAKDDNFVNLNNNMAIVSTELMSAGHPIVEELTLCPQLDKFKSALSKCGKTLVITEQAEGDKLVIKGDKITAKINCVAPTAIPHTQANEPCAQIDDKIKEAFRICGTLATEAGKRVIEASLLLEAYTCTGTNGAAMLQYWHGFDLPPHIVISKAFAAAVVKVNKPITNFGFAWSLNPDANNVFHVAAITIWFEGGAWLKTQCYEDRWPDIKPILDVASAAEPLNDVLFEAVSAIADFNDNGTVVFAEGQVMSHDTDKEGAQFQVEGLQGGKKFNGKLIKQIAPFVKSIDLTSYRDRAMFFGGEESNPIRGALIGYTVVPPFVEAEPEVAGDYNVDNTGEVHNDGSLDEPNPDPNTGWNS